MRAWIRDIRKGGDYVTMLGMSNRWCSAITLGLGFLLLAPAASQAVDRYSFVAVGSSLPVRLQPQRELGDVPYFVDVAYFIEERWAGAISWDFGLRGVKRVSFAPGLQLFFLSDPACKPYLTARFLYSLNPRNALGWRAGAGVEWDLVGWTGINNLRWFADTGVSQWFVDKAPNELVWEALRTGFSWSY